jgi:hypothetical protein
MVAWRLGHAQTAGRGGGAELSSPAGLSSSLRGQAHSKTEAMDGGTCPELARGWAATRDKGTPSSPWRRSRLLVRAVWAPRSLVCNIQCHERGLGVTSCQCRGAAASMEGRHACPRIVITPKDPRLACLGLKLSPAAGTWVRIGITTLAKETPHVFRRGAAATTGHVPGASQGWRTTGTGLGRYDMVTLGYFCYKKSAAGSSPARAGWLHLAACPMETPDCAEQRRPPGRAFGWLPFTLRAVQYWSISRREGLRRRYRETRPTECRPSWVIPPSAATALPSQGHACPQRPHGIGTSCLRGTLGSGRVLLCCALPEELAGTAWLPSVPPQERACRPRPAGTMSGERRQFAMHRQALPLPDRPLERATGSALGSPAVLAAPAKTGQGVLHLQEPQSTAVLHAM